MGSSNQARPFKPSSGGSGFWLASAVLGLAIPVFVVAPEGLVAARRPRPPIAACPAVDVDGVGSRRGDVIVVAIGPFAAAPATTSTPRCVTRGELALLVVDD